jgi:hypothetical protein
MSHGARRSSSVVREVPAVDLDWLGELHALVSDPAPDAHMRDVADAGACLVAWSGEFRRHRVPPHVLRLRQSLQFAACGLRSNPKPMVRLGYGAKDAGVVGPLTQTDENFDLSGLAWISTEQN